MVDWEVGFDEVKASAEATSSLRIGSEVDESMEEMSSEVAAAAAASSRSAASGDMVVAAARLPPYVEVINRFKLEDGLI